MPYKRLFWLHIKKSAGIATRALLKPHYVEVDRVDWPKNFIQAEPEEYNDILNNYRMILGEYQFKRCLFAKTYLYPGEWEHMFSFAFSREPVGRCVSMFYYLFWKDSAFVENAARALRRLVNTRKLLLRTSYAFDAFLDYACEAHSGESIYRPLGNHFSTHTAPMWDDITDAQGKVLLSAVFRLENLTAGINTAFAECGIDKRLTREAQILNENKHKSRQSYVPTAAQVRKIKDLYAQDFELYENARRC